MYNMQTIRYTLNSLAIAIALIPWYYKCIRGPFVEMHGHVILGIPHQPHDIGQTLMMHVGASDLLLSPNFV
jgi:hypothetical protein